MHRESDRLIGLDAARYFAFVGMVLVNFDVVMSISLGVQSNGEFANHLIGQLQGRASATFVVLAGIGLGLSGFKRESQTVKITIKRAIFLLILGLLNMSIFEGDILHYYAFYFLFGAFALAPKWGLISPFWAPLWVDPSEISNPDDCCLMC